MERTLEKWTASLEAPTAPWPMSLMWTGRWTWMRSLVLRSRSEQNRNLEKTVMANAEATGGKAAETVEASETTEEAATVVDSDGTTEGRAVETTEAAGTIEGAATAEVVNPVTFQRQRLDVRKLQQRQFLVPNRMQPVWSTPPGRGRWRRPLKRSSRPATTWKRPQALLCTTRPTQSSKPPRRWTPSRRRRSEQRKTGKGTETIGNGEATVSERDVVTTDEVVDRSSEERPKETSVAQRENDRGTHTTAPRGISGPHVGLSEKTSEWT